MLKLRPLAIDTHREAVAYLNRACTQYRAEEFLALEKIEIVNDGKRLTAILNIVDDPGLLAPDELGLSHEAARAFGLPPGSPVRIEHPSRPESLEAVRRKIQAGILAPEDYAAIIGDVVGRRYSKMEIAAFLVACAGFITPEETLGLTRAMAETGHRLHWKRHDGSPGIVVDKHCIGGIPGNRTSMIVVPIAVAHGLTIPKTSSRAITSPAGTADTMEVLARVDIDVDEMRDIVDRVGGCLIWGGRANLSPADDILITVERPLGIDTRGQMVASILSKKVTAGSTHLVIDMPIGPSAKLRDRADAVELRKLFEFVGHAMGLRLDFVFSDGSQPVGNGIGPVLEARDVLKVLRNDADAPADLRERALLVAGHLLDFDPALPGGKGLARARDLLQSGAALKAMERIIEAQGPASEILSPGALAHDVVAPCDGHVRSIDNLRLARIARMAGAPAFKGAGVDLFKKAGDSVRRGEPLFRIHAALDSDLRFAADLAERDCGYVCGNF